MLSLCCLLVTVASVFAAPETQIVGGSPAQNCEFPSIIHLQIFNQPTDNMISLCGGTLIDSTHVLTAAHCLEGNVRRVKVNIGSNNKWSPGSQSTTASRILKHGGYVHTPYLIKNDIAILTLSEPVREGGCVQFAQLAKQRETFGTRRCMAAGWGDFQFKGNSPDELYKVALPAIPHDVCTRRSRMRIVEGVLCAGDFRQGGASTCQGDSGGPLYCPSSSGQMVLAGVTSFGNKCDNEVSAFSDVGYFRDWINSNL
ncbi:chymotrypsin-1-like [Octopus bimaculoides]|uniref:chymotrypsin-1-like n=1 Tax=Octopus bimaculoides TaxID=37653 RepID=UPI00071C352E|nr:chymotrypsin-1-like [Octopus bimaculoides]|eukprot:XP_014782044.1 PREDICTED: chymotrypsin-1-like [Octopus bimaculoides]